MPAPQAGGTPHLAREAARMLLLVDYSSMLYRNYHATPSTFPMNGVHGTLNALARVIADRKPTHIALATDADWRPEFRVERLPMYKAQRVSDIPDPVTPQEAYGRVVFRALGLPVVGVDGYEAEDIIATLAARTTMRVEIYSGDRDLFALVRDPDVKVLYPAKGGLQEVDETWITAKYGIPGRAYGDFALLRGDPSDGLPGVPGIGEKTAAKLIAEHGSLENLLSAKDLPKAVHQKLLNAIDYIAAVREVVLPGTNVPLPDNVCLDFPTHEADPAVLEKAEKEHRLGNALNRMRAVLQPFAHA